MKIPDLYIRTMIRNSGLCIFMFLTAMVSLSFSQEDSTTTGEIYSGF